MKNFFKQLSIPKIIVLAYTSLITLGGVLLWLPFSSSNGEWTPFIDALFTATSATAVTGQVTLNTAAHWNIFGQTVILALIEIGGLGFMTMWVLFYNYLLKRRPNLKQRKIIAESLSLSGGDHVQKKVWNILKIALSIQMLGVILLSFEFIPTYGVAKGLYFSLFHSVSAFCNAGFDIIGNSLVTYQDQPFILLVIAGLIMAGGLGFIVWEDLLAYPKNKKLRPYTKIVLTTTGALWLFGTVLFWITESQNGSFSHLSGGEQLVNYFFLAVTPRTAGYATIDYATLSDPGIFLTILLMFIGASSGSTGGGIKVTTFVVILLVIYRSVNHERIKVLNRAISFNTIRQVFFILSAGVIVAGLATFILLLTEDIPASFGIEYILIEVFSCLGTVGLTMGLTPHLTFIGKVVLISLMVIGRVGMLTFLWSFSNRKHETRINYPEINLLVG
jgi:trk system potassium uptake protein TrkH